MLMGEKARRTLGSTRLTGKLAGGWHPLPKSARDRWRFLRLSILVMLQCGAVMAAFGPLLSARAGQPAPDTFKRTKPTLAQADRVLFTYDARALHRLDLAKTENARTVWDTMHLLAALQGLANRSGPRLYLFSCSEFGVDTDQFWFDWLTREDTWLRNRQVRTLESLEAVLEEFRACYRGLVVYDPDVPATSNLASTAAGCEDLLPVRYDPSPDSIFSLLTKQLRVPVMLWLVDPDGKSRFTGTGCIPDSNEPTSGSAKIDAYRWGLKRWLDRRSGGAFRGRRPEGQDTGACAPGIGAYYIDSFWIQHPRRAGPTMHTLANHDYFIANRAFFFDLSPWGDEVPTDDPGQKLGLDKATFLQVMRALYERTGGGIIKIGGFTPWPYKYTSHAQPPGKYDGVPTEWEFGRLISQFNGYMEADAAGLAGMGNASFYRHYPLANRYRQPNRRPGLADWKRRGYVDASGKVARRLFLGHYVGDYDAPSWLYKAVPRFFTDPARGRVPLGWAFDPNLADRAPQALVYAYRNATTNDFFIAGDSGAGYLNPRALTIRPDSGLPSGLNEWTRHCQGCFKRWDMSITGFILDGSGGASTELEFKAYARFSPDGAGTHFEKGPAVRGGIPTCPERDLPEDLVQAARAIAAAGRGLDKGPVFFWARSILKSPRWYSDLSDRLKQNHPEVPVEVVDPYTFFGLVRMALE